MTVAPASPRAAAMPRPAPLVAPATTATRPRSADRSGDQLLMRHDSSSSIERERHVYQLSLPLNLQRDRASGLEPPDRISQPLQRRDVSIVDAADHVSRL